MSYRRKHINPKIRGLKKKKRFFQQPLFWVVVICCLLTGSIFYLVLFFPPLQVKALEISGNEKVSRVEIEAMAWESLSHNLLFFSSRSILMANLGKLEQEMAERFPIIEYVAIERQWFGTIRIAITERKPFALFCHNNITNAQDCFLIDNSGIIFEPTSAIAKQYVMIRQSADRGVLEPGQAVVDKHTIGAILSIQDNLQHHFQLGITQVFLSDSLIITTAEGWQAHFDPGADIVLQITKMNLLLQEKITPEARKRLQYIYLQYKDRAYYK